MSFFFSHFPKNNNNKKKIGEQTHTTNLEQTQTKPSITTSILTCCLSHFLKKSKFSLKKKKLKAKINLKYNPTKPKATPKFHIPAIYIYKKVTNWISI